MFQSLDLLQKLSLEGEEIISIKQNKCQQWIRKHFNEFICKSMVPAEAQSQWGDTQTDKLFVTIIWAVEETPTQTGEEFRETISVKAPEISAVPKPNYRITIHKDEGANRSKTKELVRSKQLRKKIL